MQSKSKRASSFVFLAFLDLISCAFGAAILIFVVSAVTGGETQSGSQSQEVLLLFARYVDDASPELEFEITDPKGNRHISSELLPPNWRKFSAPAGSRAGSFIVIPKPEVGDWQFRVFWTDGIIGQDAQIELEVFCPQGIPQERVTFKDMVLTPSKRFSKGIRYRVGEAE